MKTFSVTDAAMEPFRVVGRRPLATIVWGLVLIAPTLIVLAAMMPMFGDMMTSGMFDPSTFEPGATPDEAMFGDDFGAMMQVQLWSNLANLIQMLGVLFVTTAIIRAVYAGRRGDGFSFLRFGKAELQVAVVGVAIFFGFCFIAVFAVLLAVALGFAANQLQQPWGVLISVALGLAVFVGLMLLWGRLALLAPASIHYKTFAFEEGWKLGKGKTWSLFGMAIVLILICIMLGIVLVTLFTIVVIAVGGGLSAMEPEALEAWFTSLPEQPALLIGMALVLAIPIAWLQGFSQILFTAPYAHVVQSLVGTAGTDDVAAEFH